MPTKSVLVRLRGDNGDLNRALLGSAAASKVLGKNLDDADKSSKRLSDGLEVSNDRTTMLIQSALALGPALVPIGAQAVPVVMGLGTQLGFAAAAAGVTALAFSGIGDSLKAVNKYAIEPTSANLQKMQEEMDKLGPAGRDFVHYLQELRPQLQVLQDLAQQGMLPGAEEGIESLMTRLPQVERVVSTIATTIGGLMADAGADLAGPEWESFFNYIESDAQPILSDMSRTAGNFVHGMADIVTAFGPLTNRFSEGFLGMSRDFEEWSAGLADSDGFQSFVTYIEQNGPQVLDTLGALSDAVLAIVEAAAPVGSVALPVIESLANVLSSIAKTPIGPVLIGAAAGISAISRAVALYKAANGSALLGSLTGARGGMGAAGAAEGAMAASSLSLSDRAFNAHAMRDTLPAMREYRQSVVELREAESAAAVAHSRYIGTMKAATVADALLPGRGVSGGMVKATDDLVAANKRHASAARQAAEAEQIKKAAIRESISGAGKAAGMVGGLAVATSGYAEKTGMANTASLALMGTIAGPWGAAIGGGVGAVMDLAASNNSLEDSFNNLKVAMDNAVPTPTGVIAFQAVIDDARNQLDAFKSDVDEYDERGGNALFQIAHPLKSFAGAKNQVEGFFGKSDVEENQAKLDAAQKKADANALATLESGRAALDAAVANDQYAGAVGRSGIAAGMTQTAIRGMVSAMQANRTEALGAFDAETQYRQALKAAAAQAKKSNAGIKGSSDAALANRAALSSLAGAWNNQSAAVRNNTSKFRAAKTAFIQTATSMGVPRKAAIELADKLMAIPRQKVIGVHMQGDAAALAAIARIKAEMASIHDKTVRLTYYVTQVNRANKLGAGANQGVPQADGGTVPKTGLPYADRHPYLLADGEEVTSNRYGQADEYRQILKAINANAPRAAIKAMLADGGTTGAWRHPQPAATRGAVAGGGGRQVIEVRVSGEMDLRRATAQIREMAREVSQGEIEAFDVMNAEIERAR